MIEVIEVIEVEAGQADFETRLRETDAYRDALQLIAAIAELKAAVAKKEQELAAATAARGLIGHAATQARIDVVKMQHEYELQQLQRKK